VTNKSQLIIVLRKRAIAHHVREHDQCEFALLSITAHDLLNIAPLEASEEVALTHFPLKRFSVNEI
jgi:hypothetical protein